MNVDFPKNRVELVNGMGCSGMVVAGWGNLVYGRQSRVACLCVCELVEFVSFERILQKAIFFLVARLTRVVTSLGDFIFH